MSFNMICILTFVKYFSSSKAWPTKEQPKHPVCLKLEYLLDPLTKYLKNWNNFHIRILMHHIWYIRHLWQFYNLFIFIFYCYYFIKKTKQILFIAYATFGTFRLFWLFYSQTGTFLFHFVVDETNFILINSNILILYQL